IAREESSSTSSGSKVFGSERKQKRNSPPLWEKAELVRARETRAKQKRNRKSARRPVVFLFMRSPPRSTRASGMTSSQQSAAVTAPAATALRGTRSTLPVRAEDFPMKAAVRQRPIRGCPDSPRSG